MFKESVKSFKSLCAPAQLYLAISLVTIVGLALQNSTEREDKYCAGSFRCNTKVSKWTMVIVQLAYALFWTLILNLLCNSGYKKLSWVLVLLPYVLFFVILTLFMLSNM